MRNKILFFMIAILVQIFGYVAFASDSGWLQDFEMAKDKAAKEGKDILLEFSGSDWCGWSIRLKKEVFDQDIFKQKITNNFILVELDFPKKKKQSEKIKEQNKKMNDVYNVQGYPTVILTDAKGDPYAYIGYEAGGAEKYINHLEELQKNKIKRDALFESANKAQGVEKAILLDQVYTFLSENGVVAFKKYKEVVHQIKILDKDNKAGLKIKYEIPDVIKDIKDKLGINLSKQYEITLKELDKLIETTGLTPEMKQTIYLEKVNIYKETGNQEGMVEGFKKAAEAAPNSKTSQEINDMLKQYEDALQEKK